MNFPTNWLITGGTGSFGINFAEHLARRNDVHRILIFSRDEHKQFQLAETWKNKSFHAQIHFALGDIRNKDSLSRHFKGIDAVVHAAALKHVHQSEIHPEEFALTNIVGTKNILETCCEQGISKVVMLSTDKACQPESAYGASKLLAEKICIRANQMWQQQNCNTKISIVRFGNFLGSRGSILPTLHAMKQKKHCTINLTHPDATRFFLSLSQASRFIEFVMQTMQGGEIFIPKMPGCRIQDLIHAIIPGARQTITGIRPGEKLHESLISPTELERVMEKSNCFVISQNKIQNTPLSCSQFQSNNILLSIKQIQSMLITNDLANTLPPFKILAKE